MKKLLSIFFAFLILLTGVHLTFATHYCGGSFAASKISVSGELASCGMEDIEKTCSNPGNHLKSHCCDNEVSVYAIDNTYTPSFSVATDVVQNILQVFTLPVSITIHSFLPEKPLLTSVSPPGKLFTSIVNLADICVFRN
jgi:hypothetical protein